MNECILCRIVTGGLDAHRQYGSEAAVALLDIVPVVDGHVFVVPRCHASTLIDMDERAIGSLFAAVKDVIIKIHKGLRPIAFNVGCSGVITSLLPLTSNDAVWPDLAQAG